jgi:hypothetical protein
MCKKKNNAYKDGNFCQTVHIFQIETRQTDFDKSVYERHATGSHPKLVLINFGQSVTETWRRRWQEVGAE